MSGQASKVKRDKDVMGFRGEISSRMELELVLGKDPRNLDSSRLKEFMWRKVKKTSAEANNVGFNAICTKAMHVLISVIKMARATVTLHGESVHIFYRNIKRWSQSEIIPSWLAKELCKDLSLTGCWNSRVILWKRTFGWEWNENCHSQGNDRQITDDVKWWLHH